MIEAHKVSAWKGRYDIVADGRPATCDAAHARLARMLGADVETCTVEETRQLVETARQSQELLLAAALRAVVSRLPRPPRTVVLAGSGEFLARRILQRQQSFPVRDVVSLTERLGPDLSGAACAYAVAVLAAEDEHAST